MQSPSKKQLVVPARPAWDEFFLQVASVYSTRATCFRRQYGAVIADREHRLVSAGYCGAPRGVLNCFEAGYCYREQHNIPAGQQYEACRSVHAEENAIIFTDDKSRLEGSTLYLAGRDIQKNAATASPPCILCAKKIVQVGMESVVLMSKKSEIRRISVKDIKEKLSKGDFSYPY